MKDIKLIEASEDFLVTDKIYREIPKEIKNLGLSDICDFVCFEDDIWNMDKIYYGIFIGTHVLIIYRDNKFRFKRFCKELSFSESIHNHICFKNRPHSAWYMLVKSGYIKSGDLTLSDILNLESFPKEYKTRLIYHLDRF